MYPNFQIPFPWKVVGFRKLSVNQSMWDLSGEKTSFSKIKEKHSSSQREQKGIPRLNEAGKQSEEKQHIPFSSYTYWLYHDVTRYSFIFLNGQWTGQAPSISSWHRICALKTYSRCTRVLKIILAIERHALCVPNPQIIMIIVELWLLWKEIDKLGKRIDWVM